MREGAERRQGGKGEGRTLDRAVGEFEAAGAGEDGRETSEGGAEHVEVRFEGR